MTEKVYLKYPVQQNSRNCKIELYMLKNYLEGAMNHLPKYIEVFEPIRIAIENSLDIIPEDEE